MGKLLASAAFYVLALAAQVSGFTSPALAAVLALVGTALLVSAAWSYRGIVRTFARSWRLRVPWERVDVAPHAAPTYAAGAADLIPITTFLRNAEAIGWRFVEPKSQALEFFPLLREATADGAPTFYGVKFGSGTTAELNGPRVKIPLAHWADFQIDAISCFDLNSKSGEIVRVKPDSTQSRTYKLTHETGYINLHLAGGEAEQWLRESLVPLEEAATRAYEQTRGRLSAGLAEGNGDSPLTWYCYALWQRIPIFGCYAPSRVLEEIPEALKNRLTFRMDGDKIVLAEYSGSGRYVNLRVRGSRLPEAIRDIWNLG